MGVGFRLTNEKIITLELSRVSSTVDVTAEADTVSASLPNYTEPLVDVPQTISGAPQSVMEQQNTTTLRGAPHPHRPLGYAVPRIPTNTTAANWWWRTLTARTASNCPRDT